MKAIFSPTITKEEVQQLPLISFKGEIVVVDNYESLNQSIQFLKNLKILGFDTESKPSFKKGQTNKISILQLANNDRCYLYKINQLNLQKVLKEILENELIIKIGLSLNDDFRELQKISKFTPKGFIDLQDYVKKFGIQEKSLKKLTAIILQMRISKSQQISNWDNTMLTTAQQIYAATDAWICLKIYETLAKFNG